MIQTGLEMVMALSQNKRRSQIYQTSDRQGRVHLLGMSALEEDGTPWLGGEGMT